MQRTDLGTDQSKPATVGSPSENLEVPHLSCLLGFLLFRVEFDCFGQEHFLFTQCQDLVYDAVFSVASREVSLLEPCDRIQTFCSKHPQLLKLAIALALAVYGISVAQASCGTGRNPVAFRSVSCT
jgi:hypothetical protein